MTTVKYLKDETLATMTVEQLTAARNENRRVSALRYGIMLGTLSIARGNVRRINAEFKRRGLDAASGRQTSEIRDESGLVAAAIAPLQAAAVQYASEQAADYVKQTVARYEGQDLEVVAPYPDSRRMGKIEYRAALSRRSALQEIFDVDRRGSYMPKAPGILTRNPVKEAKVVKDAAEAAGASFIAYVVKLEAKVGAGVTKATVDGKYLWLGSTLTVNKGQTVERWHTQQIVNYSSLGNAYNQWPTRKLK